MSLHTADGCGGGGWGEMALCSSPPTQMEASGEITHTIIILQAPGDPEREHRREI